MFDMDIRDFLRAKATELRDTARLHQNVQGEMPEEFARGMASPLAMLAEAEDLEATADDHVMRNSMVVASYHGPERMICRVDHQKEDPCNTLRKAAWLHHDDPRFEEAWTPSSDLEA